MNVRRIWRLPAADVGGAFLLYVLYVFLLHPVFMLLTRSLEDDDGDFVGLANFSAYLETPGLPAALVHSLIVAAVATVLTVLLAFVLAYGTTHTKMPGKRLCSVLVLAPLFMPSMLPGIGLVYLVGAQGPLGWRSAAMSYMARWV